MSLCFSPAFNVLFHPMYTINPQRGEHAYPHFHSPVNLFVVFGFHTVKLDTIA